MRRLAEVEPVRIRGTALQVGLGVVAPQVLYYSGVARGLAVEAIVAAVTLTLAVAIYHWRRSSLVPWMLYGVGVTAGQGTVALLVRNPIVFAAGSVVENLLGGVGFLGSIAVGRPLLTVAMTRLRRLRVDAVVLPAATRSALTRLTLLWGLCFLVRGGTLYAALISLPLGWFLVVNSLVGLPVNGLGAVASLAYLRARPGGPDDVENTPEGSAGLTPSPPCRVKFVPGDTVPIRRRRRCAHDSGQSSRSR